MKNRASRSSSAKERMTGTSSSKSTARTSRRCTPPESTNIGRILRSQNLHTEEIPHTIAPKKPRVSCNANQTPFWFSSRRSNMRIQFGKTRTSWVQKTIRVRSTLISLWSTCAIIGLRSINRASRKSIPTLIVATGHRTPQRDRILTRTQRM